MSGYEAFVLSPESREAVLKAFPPKYPDVIAHHVTHQFGVERRDASMYGQPVTVRVVGYAEEDGLEALVVRVLGSDTRPDGKTYHITLSLDRNKGKKPAHSNELIAREVALSVHEFCISCTFEYIAH